MEQARDLTNHFLIAMPGLADPNFAHTVTYICQHTEEGAMGIVVNRPSGATLGDILEQLDIHADDPRIAAQTVFAGGPVQPERGFVLHQPLGAWETSMKLTDTLGLCSSREILHAIAAGTGPARNLIVLGYAGWGPGQLEREMSENAWLSGPADPNVVFDVPAEQRWQAAAALLGVDVMRLSSDAGHA
jgi:putative transcriptional regulator